MNKNNEITGFRNCLRKVQKAIKHFSMFQRKDRLLLALSGGKDSVLLLYFLKTLNYKVEALYLDLGIKNFSQKSWAVCKKVCDTLHVPLHYISSLEKKSMAVDNIPLMYKEKECAICGTLKRQLFNRFAIENNFDVLIVAHNMDDEAAMLFNNNKKWNYSYLKKSYPVLSAQTGFIRRAKPLVYCREEELQKIAKQIFTINNWQEITSSCSYAESGSRIRYEKILNCMEKEYPNFVSEYYKSFLKNYSVIASVKEEEILLRPCKECGELTVSTLCRLCAVKQETWRM